MTQFVVTPNLLKAWGENRFMSTWPAALCLLSDRRLASQWADVEFKPAHSYETRKLHSGVELVFHSEPEQIANLSKKLFGRELSTEELVKLAGAPAGTRRVAVRSVYPDKLELRVDHPYFKFHWRTFSVNMPWDPKRRQLTSELVSIARTGVAPRHSGAKDFARMVDVCREYGVAHIVAEAAKDERYAEVGYYVWPRLGFNATLNRCDLPLDAPAPFTSAKSLHELFAMPGGAEYWRQHGHSMRVQFELSDGSPSMQRFEAYLSHLRQDESAAKVTGLNVFDAPAARPGFVSKAGDSAFE